ncbi:MAG TPA: N-acetylmuramoyl-L-alanine amidase [Verrucomicrobiae bacterium]|nr:N-acetylmuramoyl-L-alanine amidase [Verrucomicrobiae bacterium]
MTHLACALAAGLAVLSTPVFAAASAKPAQREPGTIRTIVLDPGHGGEEVGAVGHTGVFEKDLCLDIAQRLRDRLARLPDTTVLLTREDDRVVPLRERTAIANHAKADLFVSIHMNSSRRLSAHGTEAYFLALTASDEEAMTLAHAENALPSPLPGSDGNPGQPADPNAANAAAADASQNDLDLVLWGMAQSEHIVSSSRLADVVQDEMNRLLKVDSRGVKQAPFTVLMGATMPAVLVEVAFLSNEAEEKLLITGEFKDKVADALQSAIVRFKDETEKALSTVPTLDGHNP